VFVSVCLCLLVKFFMAIVLFLLIRCICGSSFSLLLLAFFSFVFSCLLFLVFVHRYTWAQQNEPAGWRGNNQSAPFEGAPLGWGNKYSNDGAGADVTIIRQKYTQAWGNREQFDSLKVNLIGGLMGLLCAFIGFMDFTSNFVPENHPLIESCNIKAILRSLVVKVMCPCIKTKKKQVKPPEKNVRNTKLLLLLCLSCNRLHHVSCTVYNCKVLISIRFQYNFNCV
jgi:hypothetical protein